ncbi:hypothetical protein U1Q18_033176 [Sarracenia purpurea var. burkii]
MRRSLPLCRSSHRQASPELPSPCTASAPLNRYCVPSSLSAAPIDRQRLVAASTIASLLRLLAAAANAQHTSSPPAPDCLSISTFKNSRR